MEGPNSNWSFIDLCQAFFLYILVGFFTLIFMTSTISSKGQITLPARLRKRFGLRPGMKLEFDESADCLVARPAFDPVEMRTVLGCASSLGKVANSSKILREQRGYERSSL